MMVNGEDLRLKIDIESDIPGRTPGAMAKSAKHKLTDEFIKNHCTWVETGPWTCKDIYALFVAGILALPMVGFLLTMVVLFLLPVVVVRLYTCRLPRPLDVVPRDLGFHLTCCMVFILALPLILCSLLWVLLVRVVTWVLCFPIGLWNFSRTRRSWKALSVFNGRPGQMTKDPDMARSPADVLAMKYGYIWIFGDIVCAVIGAMDRQGCMEFFTAMPFMLAIVPIYKHTILTNALLFDLQECHTNQWSDPLDATLDGKVNEADSPEVKEDMLRNISRVLMMERARKIVDAYEFIGFHQYPPPNRESKTVAGMQFSEVAGPLRCTLISHTTMPRDVAGHVPRSDTGAFTFIVVRLQSWNPWYQLVGEVEVNLRKDGGVEHPMLLVLDPTSKMATRAMQTINILFVEVGCDFAEFVKTMAKDKTSEKKDSEI